MGKVAMHASVNKVLQHVCDLICSNKLICHFYSPISDFSFIFISIST